MIGLILGWLASLGTSAYALNQINRPYLSVRSVGMGGVRMTTGLYDENFFNNPARLTANPVSKWTLIDIVPVETTQATASEIKALLGAGSPIDAIAQAEGVNLHDRMQIILPAYYRATSAQSHHAWAIALIASAQTDVDLRKTYTGNVNGLLDVGPALSFGHDFFADRRLSLGVTGHLLYRFATIPNYGLINYAQGQSLTFDTGAGQGSMWNADLGFTYILWATPNFTLSTGAAMQNVFGGNFGKPIFLSVPANVMPVPQPRSYGLGVALAYPRSGPFERTTVAFELTDMLNNADGSIYRLIHMGAETHYGMLAVRAGLNQGYFTAGLGLDTGFFILQIATYGEELGLTVGEIEDRRYTLNLSFSLR